MVRSREQQPVTGTTEWARLNFAPDAQIVMQKAVAEALHFKNTAIRTEHLLLGIIAGPENEASKFLLEKHPDLLSMISSIEYFLDTIGGKSALPEELQPSFGLKIVMGFALTEAKTSSPKSRINSVDLLIGIINGGGYIATSTLGKSGVGGKDLPKLKELATRIREKTS